MLAIMAAALIAIATLSGCSPDARQAALSGAADVVQTTKARRDAFYHERAEHCLAAAETFDAWRECFAPASGLGRAVDVFVDALRAAQEAHDAGEADGFTAKARELVQAAVHVVNAFSTAGLEVPAAVLQVAAFAGEI